jgi:DNA (cytosine-5)-methyltransferase 1
MMIKILDVCSGIGGFSLGLEATGGFDTVAFCEFDEFCCKVLNKHWPNVPIYKDLKEIGNEPERIIQEFDLICGGIPCQPWSLAGKQKGKEDDRHLWPYMYEIVKSKKPTWVIVENVGGFVNVALDDVCLDLEAQGYATQSFIIPACSVEAPHKRDRIWILGKLMANAQSNGEDGVLRTTEPKHDQGDTRMESSSSSDGRSEREVSQDVANSNDTGDRTPGRTTDGDRQKTVEGWQEQSQLGSSRSSEDVANPHDNGHERGLTEARNENATGQDSQIIRATDTKDISRQGNDGGDHQESRVDGAVSRSSDDGETSSSRATGVRSISEESNNDEGAGREDRHQEDNNRTLVQEGHEGIQSSVNRRLGSNQTSLKGTQVRQGDNNSQVNRVGESEDFVANAKELEDHEHDNGERTQQDREHRVSQQPRGEGSLGGTEDVAYSNSKGLQGSEEAGDTQESREEREQLASGQDSSLSKGHTEPQLGGMADGVSPRLDGHLGFEREPNIPRVATGIPDRVNRLKTLGNSIVPQIVYNIGLAILEEEERTNVAK